MRRFFSALMLGMFAVGFCVGCGGGEETGGDDAKKPATEETEKPAE